MEQHKQKRKVVRFTPDQLGYKDRGIVKWRGLMLSDHLDALREEEKERIAEENREVPEKETQAEIGEKLLHAMTNKQPVSIQEDILINGLYKGNIIGIVEGYVDFYIILDTPKGRKRINRNDIRSVSYVPYEEWLLLNG